MDTTKFSKAYEQQRKDAAKYAQKFEKGSYERLVKWYEANGFEHVSGERWSMVRRPQPYKEAPKIPKKGLGGLITNYKANLRRP